MNQNDAMTHCHAYAHGFIAMLFLKEFWSNHANKISTDDANWKLRQDLLHDNLRYESQRSDNLSFRALALH